MLLDYNRQQELLQAAKAHKGMSQTFGPGPTQLLT